MVDLQEKIGLIGCGAWGRHILRDLLGLGCEVTVVARGAETAARAGDGGADQIVHEVEDLPVVDGVVIATPTITHAEVIRSVLDRGVPIFVEKPLTPDLAEAEYIVAEAPDRVFVMDKWRYHPGVELMAEIAKTNRFGRVIGMHTERIGWGNPHLDVDGVWILAPHDLSIVLEVLGEMPDARAAVAERVGSTMGGMSALLGTDPWAHIEVSSSSPVRRRKVTLHVEEGVVVLPDGYSDRLEVYRQPDPNSAVLPEPEILEISTELPLLRELRAFVEHLGGGPPPRSNAKQGVEIVRRITELRELAGIGAV